MSSQPGLERSIGLWGATGIGVGAIVGGGVLALAGVAFATTGPGSDPRLRLERRHRPGDRTELRRAGGGISRIGRQWATVGKVIVFGVLIAGGRLVLGRAPAAGVSGKLTPFFPGGGTGLVQAMGYTFIALQGFDLIAAVGGEIRDPRHTVPPAMLYSLGAALAIYLPFPRPAAPQPAAADVRRAHPAAGRRHQRPGAADQPPLGGPCKRPRLT